MTNNTFPIDWVEDVCSLIYFVAALYENKIYSIGGTLQDDLDETSISDSYLRIVDFSKPVDSSKNSIDISTDNVTTAIRLADSVPRLGGPTLLISNAVMHMLPGTPAYNRIADAYGNVLNTTTYRPNLTDKVWNFDLESQKWDVQVSGIENKPSFAVVASDTENQVGWYYGGWEMPDVFYNGSVLVGNNSNQSIIALQDLYKLDRGKDTPLKVETDSSLVGNVVQGELVYIKGAGEAGILVLLGGNAGIQYYELRPMEIVHIFDIATKTWFAQSTTAEQGFYPDGRIAFCSVVASAEDNSSHNIYIYGGVVSPDTDLVGTNQVFILTLPAFHWVSVYPSSAINASDANIRKTSNHRCLNVHEKHMVAYRGYNLDYRCDSDTILKKFQGMTIYDMSSLTWTTTVELENPKYLVPQVLYEIIGGGATGNATFTEPRQGFQDPKLAQIFAPQVFSNKTTPPITTPTTLPTNNHLQSRVLVGAIVGGIIGGLVLIAAIFLLWRRLRIVAPPHTSDVPASTDISPQEVQDSGLYELHDSKTVPELPPAVPELPGLIP